MEKIILALCVLILTGCSTLVKPQCGELAVYKKYEIQMPARPELMVESLNSNSSIGESTRAYELDLINMIEYSKQLENILAPIADSESNYDVDPTNK